MKRIRIGKDISMRWEITTGGVAIPLEGRDLTVEIKSPMGVVSGIPYGVSGNTLIITYYGTEQKRVGEYSVTLWENKGKPGQNVVDVIRAFELVRTSQEEDDFVGGDLQIESVDLGTENFDILTEGGYRGINIDTLQAEALEDSVNINGKTYSNESFTITLPKANLDSAGVMSAYDKQTLQEHGNSIAQIKTSCEENAADIERVSNVVDAHESRLGGIDAEISSLNTEVSTLQSKVDENTTSISQINNNIADNNKSIAKINTTLEEHTESINSKITTDRIENGAVTTEKISTTAFDSTLSVSGKITPADVVGEKLSELAGKIDTKQNELTLTIKDNGNIVIGGIMGQSKEFMPATPSGDPMHYAYEASGAEWNGTGADIVKTTPWADMIDDDYDGDYGKTVVHKAGYWYLNGLGDITNDEIRKIYQATSNFPSSIDLRAYFSWVDFRTNFKGLRPLSGWAILNCSGIADGSNNFSILDLSGLKSVYITDINGINKIKHILGQNFLFTKAQTLDLALNLITARFNKLSKNIYIGKSSVLSVKSVLYMINKEAATSPITITLHADVYNRCMVNADILAALEAHPNVSLASA